MAWRAFRMNWVLTAGQPRRVFRLSIMVIGMSFSESWKVHITLTRRDVAQLSTLLSPLDWGAALSWASSLSDSDIKLTMAGSSEGASWKKTNLLSSGHLTYIGFDFICSKVDCLIAASPKTARALL